MAAYAAASSTTTALNRIASAAGEDGESPTRATTLAYREHLTQVWILDPLEAWSPGRNPFKRLQQGPKHQLADPGLAARLLGLSARHLSTPRHADVAGRLFESLATLTVRAIAEAEGARVGHLRTHDSREEIDLIVEGAGYPGPRCAAPQVAPREDARRRRGHDGRFHRRVRLSAG